MINIEIFKLIIKHFLTSGIFISLGFALLEYISKFSNMVNLFAFASASFFIINLIQFNIISNNNVKASKGFLIHTLIGTFTFFILALFMFILYLNNYNSRKIIVYTFILMTIFILSYLYLFFTNKLNF
tara:strand:+ start:89 stop:472 length:384 start_codon:yes stop_codon:yes gene_type:complete